MLGPRIAALRRQAKLSQSALARMLQVSPSAVGMYEQGRREPALDTLVKLSRIFGVSLDYLITGKTANAGQRERDGQMARILERPEDQTISRQELAAIFAAVLAK